LNKANAEFFEAVFGSMEAFNLDEDDYNPEQLHIINMKLNTICSAIAEDSQYTLLAEKCYEALAKEEYCNFLEDRGQMEAGTCEAINLQCISDFDCGDNFKCFFGNDGATKISTCRVGGAWNVGLFGESCDECCIRLGGTCDTSHPNPFTVAELQDRLQKTGFVHQKISSKVSYYGPVFSARTFEWQIGVGRAVCYDKERASRSLCYCV